MRLNHSHTVFVAFMRKLWFDFTWTWMKFMNVHAASFLFSPLSCLSSTRSLYCLTVSDHYYHSFLSCKNSDSLPGKVLNNKSFTVIKCFMGRCYEMKHRFWALTSADYLWCFLRPRDGCWWCFDSLWLENDVTFNIILRKRAKDRKRKVKELIYKQHIVFDPESESGNHYCPDVRPKKIFLLSVSFPSDKTSGFYFTTVCSVSVCVCPCHPLIHDLTSDPDPCHPLHQPACQRNTFPSHHASGLTSL